MCRENNLVLTAVVPPPVRLLPTTQTRRQKQIRGETREDAKTVTTIEYTFQCYRMRGGAKIKAFMSKAFEWYTQEMAATEDNSRYMWVAEQERRRTRY